MMNEVDRDELVRIGAKVDQLNATIMDSVKEMGPSDLLKVFDLLDDVSKADDLTKLEKYPIEMVLSMTALGAHTLLDMAMKILENNYKES